MPAIWVGFIVFGETTARYLPSFLESLSRGGYTLLAFDNTPESDNENSKMLADYPSVRVMGEGKNLGFSAAYNKMITAAHAGGADYFLVINPDTVIEQSAIKKLVAALEADPKLGSVAPKLRRLDFEAKVKTETIDSAGLVLRSGLRFIDLGQGEEDKGQYDNADIIGPSGAAGLFRLSTLEQVREGMNYFDEHFFMYKEDCDLAYRLHLAGFSSKLVPEAVVYHDRTASGGGLRTRLSNRRTRSRQINTWAFMNQHLLWIKYWQCQSLISKFAIMWQARVRFIAALLLEPYLLRSYRAIRQAAETLRRY